MNSRSDARDKIIVALDVPAKAEALDLVKQLAPEISFFKIGLQLYTVAGPEAVREILATGAKVFLDLKLHDIPNTVARAVESAASRRANAYDSSERRRSDAARGGHCAPG
jgi:orotidine-5'-phosphate decarboxylase